MYKPRGRNVKLLVALVVVAFIYAGVLFFRHTLTGRGRLDGSLGVVLGLYICSQPAANVLDMILFGRIGRYSTLSRRSLLAWWALNAVVLLLGCGVLIAGTTRFAGASR